MKKITRKFNGGQVVYTHGALGFAERGVNLFHYLARHMTGDWGDLSDDDKAENELSLEEGFRLFSAYDTSAGRLWIITEADRSATTLLLPEEY